MISEIKSYLVGFAIGIRFRQNFALQDKFGEIADNILYAKDSYFNPAIFPEIDVNPIMTKLIDRATGNYLTINTNNIILEIDFASKITLSEVELVTKRFQSDIIEGVLGKYNVTGINRVGYINKYIFTIEELSKVFIDKTIGGTLEGINEINLRFSKKLTIQESMIKKNVNDYCNVIYNIIKKADKKETFISVDFQKMYDPMLDRVNQLDFLKFLDSVQDYNSVKYLKWLNAYYER